MKISNDAGLDSLTDTLKTFQAPKDSFVKQLEQQLQQKKAKPTKELTEKEKKEDKKLRQAAENFEAFFLSQLLSQMKKTIPDGGLFGHSQQKDILEGMFDDGLSKEMAHGRGVGLADMLYKQLRPTSQKSPKPVGYYQHII